MTVTIAEILTRNVMTVSPQVTLSECANRMAEHKISCLIVVSGKKPVGIITESDLVHAGSRQLDIEATLVGSLIDGNPVSIDINQNVYDAFEFLIDHHIRHLIVVDAQGHLEGLLTFTDILKATSFDDFLKAKLAVDEMSRNVAAIAPESSVLHALAMMDQMAVSCLIINRDDQAYGIFTERDAARMVAQHMDLEQICISEVMTAPIITMPETVTLLEVSVCMRESDIRRMVIVDRAGKATGVLTQFDVIRGLEGQRIRHFKALHEQAEDKLAESQRLLAEQSELERIVSASPAVLYRYEWREDQFMPTYFSAQLESMLGYTPSLFIQTSWWHEFVHPDDQCKVFTCLSNIIDKGAASLTYRVRARSGEWVWILNHACVYTDADGKPLEMVGSWLNVTERKKAEEILKQREETLQSIFDSANDAIYLVDPLTHRIVDCNNKAAELDGYSVDELKSMTVQDLYPESDLAVLPEKLRAVIENGLASTITGIHHKNRDGRLVPVEVNVSAVELAGKKTLLSIVRDVSDRQMAEQALKGSEEKYRTMVESSNDAIFVADAATGTLVDANEQAEKLLGLPREKIIGMHQTDLHPPEEMERYAKIFADHIHDERSFIPDILVRRRDGTDVPVDISSNKTEIGGKTVLQGVFRDISGRKKTEERLRLAQFALDHAVDAIYWMTNEGRFVYVNEAATRMLGYSRDELLNMGVEDIDPSLPDGVAPEMVAATKAQGFGRVETSHRSKDGRLVPVEVTVGYFEFGEQEYHCSFVRDISERQHHQLALEKSEARYRTLVDNLKEVVFQTDVDGNWLYLNHSWQEITGFSVEESLGKLLLDYVYPDDRELNKQRSGPLLERQQEYSRHEIRYRHKDGGFRWIEVFTRLTLDEHDQVTGTTGMLTDITERKYHEQEVRQAAERMHRILDADFDAVVVHQDFNVVFSNRQAQALFGYASLQETLGENILGCFLPEQRRLASSVARRAIRTGQPTGRLEMTGLSRARKEPFHMEVASTPIQWGGKPALVSIIRDITERRHSEEQMRLLKSAVAAVNESIIITDAEGVIVYVNPSFTDNTGYTVEDAVGKTPAILNSKEQSEDFYQQFWDTIKGGKSWSGRILDRKKDGTIFPVHLSVAPINDMAGKISYFVAVHEDLSQSEVMQKKVVQSQKMEAVATMVGGVAHDFNNLLASITGNLYLMRSHHKDDEKTVKRIRGMETNIQHGAQLIQQMLTFARKDRTEMQSMDLKTFIKEAHRMAHASIPENIRFTLDYPSDLDFWIKGDATQLQQVLLNLVTNAHHAVENTDHPVITVALSRLEPDSMLLAKHAELADHDKWCCLKCSDNGAGIEPGLIERIFEPFFTTKAVGKGTGLGLAMVYGAVQNHQGIIDVSSEPGSGTAVSIYLPLHKRESAQDVHHDEAAVDGQGCTVLLVDDEAELRQVLGDVLRHNGFAVLQASDGEEAVDMFAKHRSSITLVLMDVVMPNKGGVIAAREIRAISDDVPIIFQTGYGEQTQLDAAAAISNSESLQKPVQIAQLMEMIVATIRSGKESGNEL